MSVVRFALENKLISLGLLTLLIQTSVLVGTFLSPIGDVPDDQVLATATHSNTPSSALAKTVTPQTVIAQENTVTSAHPDTTTTTPATIQTARLKKEKDLDPRSKEYKLKNGDTLTSIWTNNGASYKGAILAAKAFEKAKVSLSSLRSGEKVDLLLNEEGDIVRFEKKLSSGKKLILEGDSENGYKHTVKEEVVVEARRTATGVIQHSFSSAAQRVAVPYSVIDELVDLFSSRLEFRRDLQPGDSFSIVYNERRLKETGEELEPGYIVAASLKNQGQMFVAVRHEGKDKQARYYDESGQALGNFFLRYPLRFSRISSMFNKSRFHPILKRRRPHNGVDFAAPVGTPVRAVADGVITTSGYKGGAGKMVKIQHDRRWASAYLHLSKFNVKRGQRVKRGQVIGSVGMTGYATGPHLHFSLYDHGRYVDPLRVKLPRLSKDGEKIPGDYLQATVKELEKNHSTLQMALAKELHPVA